MSDAVTLISALKRLNGTGTTTIANFTPSLIGMFGSIGLFEAFLDEIATALESGKINPNLKKRAANLTNTFIPQVAEYNGIKDPAAYPVSPESLGNISIESLTSRKEGVAMILSALMLILSETGKIG